MTGNDKQNQPTAELLADVPISDPADDRLDRVPFAHALADAVLRFQGEEPFVMGLNGAWGSGKSSLLNLVLSDIDQRHLEMGEKPIVIRFNPWWFSGQQQLLVSFLAQFGEAVGRQDAGGRLKGLGQKVGLLGKALRPAAYVPGLEILRDVSEVLGKASGATKALGEAEAADVYQMREDIASILRKGRRRILVVMDDIDRLAASEIAQLFLIIKGVADFPFTFFLLAFDRRIVAEAITKALQVRGEDYLEKIVQLPIEVPAPPHHLVQNLFLKEIGATIGRPSTQDEFSDVGNAFHDGIKHFLKTVRDAKRLSNAFRMIYAPIRGEIYYPDVLGVACLMVFCKKAYDIVRDQPDFFTGHSDTSPYGENTFKREQEFHAKWIKELPEDQAKPVVDLVARLFPKFQSRKPGGGISYGESYEREWRLNLRVCAKEHFPKYFQMAIPKGMITEGEWGRLMGVLEDNEAVFDAEAKLFCKAPGIGGHCTRAKELLLKANDHSDSPECTPEQAIRLFTALLRVGDALTLVRDEEAPPVSFIDNTLRLKWALRGTLRKAGAREQVALAGVQQPSCGLTSAAALVDTLGSQHGMFGARETDSDPLVSRECVDQLVVQYRERLKAATKNGELFQHERAVFILTAWQELAPEDNARSLLNTFMESDQGLVRAITAAARVSHSWEMGDRVARRKVTINTDFVATLPDLATKRQRAAGILASAPEWLTDEQHDALGAFLAAVNEDGTVKKLNRFGEPVAEPEDDEMLTEEDGDSSE